jgi:exosortase family protein XrtF
MKDFRPALRFLLTFVGIYVAGNVLYGIYVEYYAPGADPATTWVTSQIVGILKLLGQNTGAVSSDESPYVLLTSDGRTILRVFEGCNGINVVIVFIAFIVALGGKSRPVIIFLLTGFLIIHLANLTRILLLYFTAMHRPLLFYYFHKYFFTAALYGVVFLLWIAWTRMRLKKGGIVKV